MSLMRSVEILTALCTGDDSRRLAHFLLIAALGFTVKYCSLQCSPHCITGLHSVLDSEVKCHSNVCIPLRGLQAHV